CAIAEAYYRRQRHIGKQGGDVLRLPSRLTYAAVLAVAAIAGLGAGLTVGLLTKSQSHLASTLAPAAAVSTISTVKIARPLLTVGLPALRAKPQAANNPGKASAATRTTPPSPVVGTPVSPLVSTPVTPAAPSPSSSAPKGRVSHEETITSEEGGHH